MGKWASKDGLKFDEARGTVTIFLTANLLEQNTLLTKAGGAQLSPSLPTKCNG